MPQVPNVTLPKVTRYLLNVGKSVKFATIDYLGEETAPNIANFMETNEDLFKEIYSATVNYRDTFRKASKTFKQSRIYEAGEVGFKALVEDLKTGNFYNKEREDALGMKALDMDMDDLEFDDSAFDFGDDDSSDTARQTRSINTSIEAATNASTKATVETGNMIAGTMKASTKMIWAQNEKLMASMTAGMGTIHSAISNVGNFLQGPMLTALQNTKTYQEEAVKHFKKTEAQLDEFLEMQRNLYKATPPASPKDTYGSVVDYDGIPDLKEYGKVIFKNFKSILGPEADMLLGDSFGKNANMLLTLVASPLKAIPELIVKTVVPLTVKKSLEAVDKSLGGLFPQLVAVMNSHREDQGIMGFLGRLFGIQIEKKRSINTSKYNKGPVPFDGVVRQSIIEVIPGHLARIEAALTGQSERVYNLESGRWTTHNEIKKSFDDRREAAEKMSWYDARQAVDEYVRELRSGNNKYNVKIGTQNKEEVSNRDLANQLEKLMDHIVKKTFEDGYFLGNKNHKDDVDGEIVSAGSYYTGDLTDVTEAVYEELMKRLGNRNEANRSKLNNIAGEIAKSRQSYNQYLYNIENMGYGVENKLFNGAFKNANSSGQLSGNQITHNNIISLAKDEKGNNIFYYLQRIYAALLTGGSGKRGKRGTGIANIDDALKLIEDNTPKKNNTTEPELIEMLDENGEVITVDASENWEMKKIIDAKIAKEAKKRSENDTLLGTLKSKMSLGKKFTETRKVIADYIDQPAKLVDNLIKAVDKRMYEVFYGREEMLDVEKQEGNKFNGIMDRFLINMEETFDKIDDWLHENLFKSVKEFLHETGWDEKINAAKEKAKELLHWQDIKDSFSRKFGIAKSSVKDAFQSVGSDIYNSSAGQQVASKISMMNAGHREDFLRRAQAPTVAPGWIDRMTPENWSKYNQILQQYIKQGLSYEEAEARIVEEHETHGFAANGKYITKRGLVMVSPGETIIPAGGKRTQQIQLAREKAMARRIGFRGPMYATGTSNALDEDSPDGIARGTNITLFPGGQTQADQEATQSTMRKILGEMGTSTKVADTITSGLIGSGVSLITGMIGGPLLGAAVGAGLSVIKNSETANRFVFGEEVTDIATGETVRKGGLISDDIQKKFTKYFPDMKNYGIVGSIAGLFTPFGLVGGLMLGGAAGFLKNNESFQEAIFGPKDENGERDGGLISKEFRERLTKAAPRMLIGTAGAALLGPFGIIGNAVLGSALGYVTTTDKFHEFIFGVEQDDGTTKGGIANALKDGFVTPMKDFAKSVYEEAKDFFKNKVIDPLKEFVKPATQMVKNLFTAIGDKISDSIHEKVVTPISDFVQHKLLEPFGNVLMKMLRIPIGAAKAVIGAPVKMLQGIGNNIRGTQIAKGTATDMTAAERVKWRSEHMGRSMFGKIIGKDKFNTVDQMLVSEFEGKEGLEQLKGMRDALNIYMKNSKKIGATAAKLQQKLIVDISDFLNERTLVDKNGKTVSIYTHVGYKPVNRINKIIANGEADAPSRIAKELNDPVFKLMSPEDKAELMNIIQAQWPGILAAIEKTGNELKDNDAFLSAMGVITKQKLTGRKDMRTLMRNLDKEISTRESEAAWGVEDDENSDAKLREEMANNRLKILVDTTQRQHDELIEVLNAIGSSLSKDFKPIVPKREDGTENKDAASIDQNRDGRPDKDIEEDHQGGPTGNEYTNPEAQERYNSLYEEMIEIGYTDEEARNLAAQTVTREFGIDPRQYEHGKTQKIGGIFRRAKNKISNTINTTKRNVIKNVKDFAGDARHFARGAIDTLASIPKGAASAVAGGFKSAAENTESGRGFFDDFAASQAQLKGGVSTIGGILQGPKDKIKQMFNSGYHTNEDGQLVNGKGEFLDQEDQDAHEAKQEEDNKYKQGLLGGIQDVAEGTLGLVGNLFGKAWRSVKTGVGKFGELASMLLDSTGIVGQVIKGIFGVGKVILTVSMIGHAVAFFQDVLGPVVAPIWDNICKALSGIGQVIFDAMPESIQNGITDIKNGIEKFLANPLDGIVNFIVDGLWQFWKRVATPLMHIIWKAIKADNINDLKYAGDVDTYEEAIQVRDKDGNLLYKDKDGNVTTEAEDDEGNANEAIMEYGTTNTTTEDGSGIVARATNAWDHGLGLQEKGSIKRIVRGNEIAIRNYGDTIICIRNEDNGDFIRFKTNSTKIEIGCIIKAEDDLTPEYDSDVTTFLMNSVGNNSIKWSADLAYNICNDSFITPVMNPTTSVFGQLAHGGNMYHGVGHIISKWSNGNYNKYKMKDGKFYLTRFVMVDSQEAVNSLISIAAELGWNGSTKLDTYDDWPVYYYEEDKPTGEDGDDPDNPSGTNQTSNYRIQKLKAANTANAAITAKYTTITSSNLSPTDRSKEEVALAKEYSEYALYIDQNAKILYNPGSMTPTKLYTADGIQYTGEVYALDDVAFAQDLLDPADLKGKVQGSTSAIKERLAAAYKARSGSGRSRSGTGHLYQNAVDLANKRFGNSTIGEAGCGPVAATNLINKLGGSMDIDTAASYAENGGFIDGSTGGATTDYLHSILNKSGISTGETTSKSDVLNSLRSGNPVMMLGNSGRESGTPFGANDHYITAMGLDNSGNALVEDPDLPGGYKKYPAVDVLRDMDVGITTGMSRRKARSGRAKNLNSDISGSLAGMKTKASAGTISALNSTTSAVNGSASSMAKASKSTSSSTSSALAAYTTNLNNTIAKTVSSSVKATESIAAKTKHAVPAWTIRCCDLIAQCESANVGLYQAVNANDVGSMSIGKYQFRTNRCSDLLKRIITALINRGISQDTIIGKIGSNIYNYAMSGTSDKYVPTSSEIEGVKEILGTDDGIIQQDLKMVEDCINLYLATINASSYWPKMTIKDNEDVIIFLSNIMHNKGNLQFFRDGGGSHLKSVKSDPSTWTLDDVYEYMVKYHPKMKPRAEKSYNYLKNTTPAGDGTKYITGLNLAGSMAAQTSAAADQISSGSGAHEEEDTSAIGMLGTLIKSMMNDLYGDSLMSIFGGSATSTSSDGSFSSDGTYTGTLNAKANSAQQALVDRMNSVHGKLRYSLNGGEQDPDQGVASCASTVGWAYRKVLKVGNMSAGSSTQSKDSRFTTIWTKTGSTGSPPQDLLQPGDILYINWARQNKPFDSSMQYPMAHTEMYDGSGGTINHGGGNNGTTYGTTNHQLSTRNNYIMKVRRYTPFINGEKPDFWNLDGSQGSYEKEKTSFRDVFIPSADNPMINANKTPSISDTIKMSTDMLKTGMTLPSVGKARRRGVRSALSRSLNPKELNKSSMKLSEMIEGMETPEEDNPPAGTSRHRARYAASGKSRTRSGGAGFGNNAVTYDDFLEVIISLLQVIAKNSDNLTEIVSILRKNYNVDIKTTDVTAGKSRKDQLKSALRRSGLGRGGYTSSGTNEFGSNTESSSADLQYVVNILRDMASS